MIVHIMIYLLYLILILVLMTLPRGRLCLPYSECHAAALCSCWAFFTGNLFLTGLAPLFLYISVFDQKYGEIPEPAQWMFFILVLYCQRDYHIAWAVLILAGGAVLSASGMLGFGDVRLLAAAALFLGEHIVLVTSLASLSCLLLNLRKKGSQEEIPFGPYICFAILAVSAAQGQLFFGSASGSANQNVLPLCKVLSTPYAAWCSSSISFTMANPMPLPDTGRTCVLSTL